MFPIIYLLAKEIIMKYDAIDENGVLKYKMKSQVSGNERDK